MSIKGLDPFHWDAERVVYTRPMLLYDHTNDDIVVRKAVSPIAEVRLDDVIFERLFAMISS